MPLNENIKLPLFYKSKPLFGFDVGHGSIKVVQLDNSNKNVTLSAYGSAYFDAKAIRDGEIVDFDSIARATHILMNENMMGEIKTNRISASLPVLHTFSRIINLPIMEDKDVREAVRLEAEQYIPVSINDLYLDYQLVEKTDAGQDFLVAAAPKRVVDSFVKLFNMLGLEIVCLEPSILSVTRLVQHAEDSNSPTLVIDCGSTTTDLIIYNRSTVRVTGTIKFGGETFTSSIMKKLAITYDEAAHIKNTQGIDAHKDQGKIVNAITPDLSFLVSEIQKVIRFYEERDKAEEIKVQQIILLGGGANMPGLSTYLTSELRIASRLASVWKNIKTDQLQRPEHKDSSMYSTAAGLALIPPKEAVK
jgi:type IV pilus assembly protein PilM